jgi:hypothetical protein
VDQKILLCEKQTNLPIGKRQNKKLGTKNENLAQEFWKKCQKIAK